MAKKETVETNERVKGIYTHVQNMVDLRMQSQGYFNDRNLIEFLDDSEKRWNSYTPSREAQGKDNWQSNFFHPTTRNKVKAIIASATSSVPVINIKAANKNQESDVKRAYVMKNLVKESYDTEDLVDSTQTQNFFEALETVSVGTVITHCTYENIVRDKKIITSYDVATGEYEFETKKEVVRDQCSDDIIPLNEIYPASYMVKQGSIQKQPRIAWIKYYTEEEFNDEFGEYKKAKDVKALNNLTQEEQERFFYNSWSQRVEQSEGVIEVVRMYSVMQDEYVIVANGVLILDVPMLWEYKNEKVYPFAKTIFEPFATDFFYGNPLPNALMGEQDIINSLYNMLVDKTYRTLDKQLAIGNVNRDSFDLDEQSSQDSIIYVSEVNQIKEMPTESVNQAEFNMVNLMSRGLDLSSVDQNQSGVAGRGVTAREIVIANENAMKLGGIFRMFLSNHWKQKTILRIGNILRFYSQDKVDYSDGIESPKVVSRVFEVENAELSNGQQGTLGLEIVPEDQELPTRQELDQKESQKEKDGEEQVEFMAIKSSFITEWHYDVVVKEESIEAQNESVNQAKLQNKLKALAAAFPQLFALNQEKLFKDTVKSFGDDPSEYDTQVPLMPQLPPGEAPQNQPQDIQE